MLMKKCKWDDENFKACKDFNNNYYMTQRGVSDLMGIIQPDMEECPYCHGDLKAKKRIIIIKKYGGTYIAEFHGKIYLWIGDASIIPEPEVIDFGVATTTGSWAILFDENRKCLIPIDDKISSTRPIVKDHKGKVWKLVGVLTDAICIDHLNCVERFPVDDIRFCEPEDLSDGLIYEQRNKGIRNF